MCDLKKMDSWKEDILGYKRSTSRFQLDYCKVDFI